MLGLNVFRKRSPMTAAAPEHGKHGKMDIRGGRTLYDLDIEKFWLQRFQFFSKFCPNGFCHPYKFCIFWTIFLQQTENFLTTVDSGEGKQWPPYPATRLQSYWFLAKGPKINNTKLNISHTVVFDAA